MGNELQAFTAYISVALKTSCDIFMLKCNPIPFWTTLGNKAENKYQVFDLKNNLLSEFFTMELCKGMQSFISPCHQKLPLWSQYCLESKLQNPQQLKRSLWNMKQKSSKAIANTLGFENYG